jgi:hypothetical protein
MRVPRIVFASLALIILGLSSRLLLVEARAHSAGTVMVLRMKPADGREIVCPISVVDAKRGGCSGMLQIDGQVLAYSIAFVRQEGDRVLLRVRSEYPAGSIALSPEVAKGMPGSDLWFAPGEPGELAMAGGVKMQITGEWMDHMPIFIGETGDPKAGELRVISPVILKDGKVVGDLQGMSATAMGQKYGVVLFVPGEGRFSFSPVSITGSMEAKVSVNRVSFVENGQRYQVLGGLPVTRAGSVWVRHEPAATGLDGETDRSEAGTELVSQMQ